MAAADAVGVPDAGPRSEVEAVRKLMPGPLVPYVVVYGSWAMGEWHGAGVGTFDAKCR
jgi:hypothetical protein